MNTASHHPLLDHWLIASPAAFTSLHDVWAALAPSGLLPLRLQESLVREVAPEALAEALRSLATAAPGTTVHLVVDRFGPDHDAALHVMRELPLDIHLHEWLESPVRVACALGTPDLALSRQLGRTEPPAAHTAPGTPWLRRYTEALVRWAGHAREEFDSAEVDSRWPTNTDGWLSLLGLQPVCVAQPPRLTPEAANDELMNITGTGFASDAEQMGNDLLLGGKLVADHLVRHGYQWPIWPRLCHAVLVDEIDPDKARDWHARLTGELGLPLEKPLAEAKDLAQTLRDSAELAWRARPEPGPPVDGEWPPPDLSLQDALWLDALREGNQVPKRLQACGPPLRLNLLYVEPGQTGGAARLQLWRLPLPPSTQVSFKPAFVPAPAARLYQMGSAWTTALGNAAALVASLLNPDTPACAWVWDLHPIAAEGQPPLPLWQLQGASAGAALALGVARLMVDSVAGAERRALLQLVDFSRIAVTAQLAGSAGALAKVEGVTATATATIASTPSAGALAKVEGVPYKLAALQRLQGGSLQPTHAFFGPDQGHEPPTDPKLQAIECKDFAELLLQAAGHTGGLLSPDEAALHGLLLLDSPVTDRQLVRRVAGARPANLRAWLVHRWAVWASDRGQDALADPERLDQHFVNLQLRIARRRLDGEMLDEASGIDEHFDSLAALLAEHPEVRLWLMEAVPGAGKTTLLAALEMSGARDALRCLGRGDRVDEICVWLPLRRYPITGTGPTPQALWQGRYPDMPELLALVPQGSRLRLIFDGINEMGGTGADPATPAFASLPPADRLERMQTALDGLTQWLAEHSSCLAPAIFSVQSAELTFHLVLNGVAAWQVRLALFSPEQMNHFCHSRLEPSMAKLLVKAIERDPDVAQWCALPINLAFQTLLLPHLGRPAANRAELFSGVIWFRLVREFGRATFDAPGLLDELDRRALNTCGQGADIRLPANMLRLPDGGLLVRTMDRLAMAMQNAYRDRAVEVPELQLACDTGIADARLLRSWVAAAEAMDVVRVAPLDRSLRFTHQLLQEFHAARCINGLEPEKLPDFAAPQLEPIEQTYARLREKERLPEPGVSSWEETAKLAVQLAGQPEPLLHRLMVQNLALAGRAVAARLKSGRAAGLPEALLHELREALVQRSRDSRVDLRHRIAAGLALGELGDTIRYEDCENRTGGRMVRYRMPKPELWVPIKGERYTIGCRDGEEEAYADEGPPIDVRVEPFFMAFAPVTNAEYAHFIKDDGYDDPQWWGSGDSQAWREAGERRQPRYWDDLRFANPAQPVVGVTLWEAMAYCRWLSHQCSDGKAYRLPTEAQWEAAARGIEGQRYPWGDVAPSFDHCNHGATHLQRTSPVGVFPKGDRHPALVDLAGNCWEWTCSKFTDQLEADALTSPAAEADGNDVRRALRGGDWDGAARNVRAAHRYYGGPSNNNLGFRVVACPNELPGP